MVAKITILKRLLDALNYNEQKVQKGKASCIAAGNYLCNPEEMNFYQKLSPLKNLDELNTRATTKTLHVSLNFDPSEKLGPEQLTAIAASYMEKIGFGDQPYLVYRHEDAGHPHIHIVSTAVQPDGSRINTHNIGKNQSEKARKEIEQSFGLVKASSKTSKSNSNATPEHLHRIDYGKSETKASINQVVSTVFRNYAFTSLPEFNAALKQFGVVADRGSEGSRIYTNRGLVYRILDPSGKTIGVPIKASLISGKPTLYNLETRYLENQLPKEAGKKQVKYTLDECFNTKPATLTELIELLKQRQVYTVLRQAANGSYYGITFVDNRSKCIYNGSDIGKAYSIAGIQQRLKTGASTESPHIKPAKDHLAGLSPAAASNTDSKLIQEIIQPTHLNEQIPFELRKKKKRRKKD